jgi:hypothetical protein
MQIRPAHEETAAAPRKWAFLYVNPGLGTLGLPLRLGMPPEITVLTLRAAGGTLRTAHGVSHEGP